MGGVTPKNSRGFLTAAQSAGVFFLFAATLIIFWNGVGPNDSERYVRIALRWLEDGPTLGQSHWSLRMPIVAPLAASFAAFGVSEFVSTLPNILYAAALVAVTFLYGRKHLGANAGAGAAMLVASSAFLVAAQTELTIVGPEILLGALACWLFIDGAGEKPDLRRLGAAGLVAGLAWLCREIVVYLPLAFALILVARRPLPIREIAVVGGAFAFVVLFEFGAYWLIAGDPLYRLETDFGHRGEAGFYDLPDTAPEDPLVARLVLPIFFLLSAPAVTPFVALAAALFLFRGFRRTALARDARLVTVTFGVSAATAFLVSAYGANLKSPDYYSMAPYTAFLAMGIFAGRLFDSARPRAATAFLAAIMALNAAAADFRRYDELAEPRFLARFILASGEAVVTDPATAARTRLLLRLRQMDIDAAETLVLSSRAVEPALFCGLVYVATPTGARRGIEPLPDWRLAWTGDVRKERQTIRLIRALIPGELSFRTKDRLKIAPPVALYRPSAC
jgi:4-amino-4-deoxy-L-arabinose transferase-like glycosyltransferase